MDLGAQLWGVGTSLALQKGSAVTGRAAWRPELTSESTRRSSQHPRRVLALSTGLPTCVAQGDLGLVAGVVVPLARVLAPLDVHLHTVLFRLLVVGLPDAPVLGFGREGLVGPHPGPHACHLPDPNPVVGVSEGQCPVQVLNLPLVLYGNQIGVVLLAVPSSFWPVHGFFGMMVSPAVGPMVGRES